MHNLLKYSSKPIRRLREDGLTLKEARVAVEYLMDTDPDNDILNTRNVVGTRGLMQLGTALHELRESQDFKSYKFRRSLR
jgi:hypothetical protein